MTKRVRVNIRSVANVAAARRETRNGRELDIVPSATLPDNIIMNEVLYPADEIARGFASLERTPAPLGHPVINGNFVSARDPEGINISYIGAWNENVRQENGRVLLDKVIDVDVANRSAGGRAVLAAIKGGDPIHTSTGLFADFEESDQDGIKFIARNMAFDHDAILLGQEGAATPAQGVGIFVNAKGESEEIEVVNSAVTDDAMTQLGWAVDDAVRAVEKLERASLVERLMAVIKSAITGGDQVAAEKGDSTMAEDTKIEALEAKVNGIESAVKSLGDQIKEAVANAVKPLTDNLAEITANQEAKDKAELGALVEKIVKANLMDAETAGELTLNAARALAKQAEPGKAAAINAGNGETADVYDFNEVMGLKETKGAA
jgi:hypothetical protein